MDGSGATSAPARERAGELTLLTDPAVRAVVPPWGGELAIEVVPHVDVQAGTASLHGQNLMDTPYLLPQQVMHWSDVAALPGSTVFEVAGRLTGGCIEVLAPLAGTPHGDVAGFARAHAAE